MKQDLRSRLCKVLWEEIEKVKQLFPNSPLVGRKKRFQNKRNLVRVSSRSGLWDCYQGQYGFSSFFVSSVIVPQTTGRWNLSQDSFRLLSVEFGINRVTSLSVPVWYFMINLHHALCYRLQQNTIRPNITWERGETPNMIQVQTVY